MLYPCSSKFRIKKLKEKEKENRNDLDILPSHDRTLIWNEHNPQVLYRNKGDRK